MAGSLMELSAHRFNRAKEELQTAELLMKNESYRQSINRSYYAIFHAVRAVNALDGFDSSKHSGVIAHFNQQYVKTGVFKKEASKIQLLRLGIRHLRSRFFVLCGVIFAWAQSSNPAVIPSNRTVSFLT